MTAAPSTPVLCPPTGGLGGAVARWGGLGLIVGLLAAGGIVVRDQRAADTVAPVFTAARAALLFQRSATGSWPVDGVLASRRDDLFHARFNVFRVALARCEVAGVWTFRSRGPAGRPVVVFTPAEPGRAFERALAVVDGWVDDGEPGQGDFRVFAERAELSFSAE